MWMFLATLVRFDQSLECFPLVLDLLHSLNIRNVLKRVIHNDFIISLAFLWGCRSPIPSDPCAVSSIAQSLCAFSHLLQIFESQLTIVGNHPRVRVVSCRICWVGVIRATDEACQKETQLSTPEIERVFLGFVRMLHILSKVAAPIPSRVSFLLFPNTN